MTVESKHRGKRLSTGTWMRLCGIFLLVIFASHAVQVGSLEQHATATTTARAISRDYCPTLWYPTCLDSLGPTSVRMRGEWVRFATPGGEVKALMPIPGDQWFSPGQRLTVHYDPRKPHHVLLHAHTPGGSSVMVLLMLAAIALLAVWPLLARCWRRLRPSPPPVAVDASGAVRFRCPAAGAVLAAVFLILSPLVMFAVSLAALDQGGWHLTAPAALVPMALALGCVVTFAVGARALPGCIRAGVVDATGLRCTTFLGRSVDVNWSTVPRVELATTQTGKPCAYVVHRTSGRAVRIPFPSGQFDEAAARIRDEAAQHHVLAEDPLASKRLAATPAFGQHAR